MKPVMNQVYIKIWDKTYYQILHKISKKDIDKLYGLSREMNEIKFDIFYKSKRVYIK